MSALGKYKTEIAAFLYWLFNAGYTVHVSRKIGFYPKSIRAKAQLLADAAPYPWSSIFITWLLLAIATIGIYLILSKAEYKILWLLIYSLALLFLVAIMVPTDVGGVYYAVTFYPFFTFCIVLLLLVWAGISLIRKKFFNAPSL